MFAAWNPRMHRVELVTKVTEDRCGAQGVTSIWDNLRNLVYADVSMGARVPGDLCSVHADWEELRKAQATYNPRVHANEGVAVAEYHKRRPIRGWARTRKEYCEDMLKRPNAILADGRKVFVYNHYPKFFDISYVFVGADRTAKAMIHVASPATLSTPSEKFRKGWSAVFEDAGAQKTASASKHGTIYKSNIPSNQVPAVVRNISNKEMDLPDDLLSEIGSHDTPAALSTLSSLGIVLKPSEFQRVVLVHRGHSDLADRLSKRNLVFERGAAEHPMALPDQFIPRLVELLRPFIRRRSALHEPLEIRIAVGLGSPDPGPQNFGLAPSALFPELAKMGSRYAEYREAVLPHLSYTPHVLQSAAEGSSDLRKLAQSSVENLFSSLTVEYLRSAFRE